MVTLFFPFPRCVCKTRTFLKQLNPSVLAPTSITVVGDSGNEGFGVTAPDSGRVTDLASPVLLLSKPSSRARASLALPGRVPPGQCALAAALRAPGFSTRSYFRQRCSVSLPRAYETLFWDSSPDSLFPLPPHAGKHRLADDFFGKLLRRGEQEAPGRTFNPRVYLLGLRKVGIFPCIFLFFSAAARLKFSASRIPASSYLEEIATELTHQHTIWPPQRPDWSATIGATPYLAGHAKIAERRLTTPIIKGPNAPSASAQLQTTEQLCFGQWQTVGHGSHPPSKPFCLFVCLFVCHRTRAGFSRHLPALSVGAAPHKCERSSHFTSFPCNFCLSAGSREMAAWCRLD